MHQYLNVDTTVGIEEYDGGKNVQVVVSAEEWVPETVEKETNEDPEEALFEFPAKKKDNKLGAAPISEGCPRRKLRSNFDKISCCKKEKS